MENKTDLTTLGVNDEYRLENLAGKWREPTHPGNGNGVIGIRDDGHLFFRQAHAASYAFNVRDSRQEEQVKSFLQKGFVNLAAVRKMTGDGTENVHLYVVFFADQVNLDSMKIIFTKNLIQRLEDRHMIRDKEDLDPFLASFYLQDGMGVPLIAYTVSTEWSQPDKSGNSSDHAQQTHDEKASARGEKSQAGEGGEKSITQEATGAGNEREEHSSHAGTADEEGERTVKLSRTLAALFQQKPHCTMEIHGVNGILRIGLYQDETEGVLAIAQSLVTDVHHHITGCLRLAHCSLSTSTEQEYCSLAVKEVMMQENTYTKLWESYAKKEEEFLFKRARAIGILKWNGTPKVFAAEDNTACLTVIIEPESRKSLRLLSVRDRLKAAKNPPSFLTMNEHDGLLQYQKYCSSGGGHEPGYEIMRMSPNGQLDLKPLDSTNLSGVLFLDTFGDQSQIDRRRKARTQIETGQSANPHLGYIIGGGDEKYTENIGLLPKGNKIGKRIPALTDAVKNKLFPKHAPTVTQKEAIDIALNTPDIAIIQGPPGTGKTTVITAILERLNELADKRIVKRGQVLITSLQHDAVYNVIERISINSLPTVKFGKRRGEDQLSDLDDVVTKWCEELAARLRAKNPELKESLEEQRMVRAFSFYRQHPVDANAESFLMQALACGVTDDMLRQDIEQALRKYQQRQEEAVTATDDPIICKIERLRTTPAGFADGGADLADDLLMDLEQEINQKNEEDVAILKTLEEAADCYDRTPSQDLLQRLADCKHTLLKRCIPQPHYRQAQVDGALEDIYCSLMDELHFRRKDKTAHALSRLLYALENDPDIIRETLKEYSFAYAATAQQSMGKEITDEKGRQPVYDTVIVDEAARVNPGDLMIPLSQAENRIILVGDHRQLPHMYDDEIFEELMQEGVQVHAEDIRESMFEHLLKRAKKLSEKDHIPRFVTLDQQFRMHPELGQFVSQNFYEPHGEGFRSPLGAENFVQDLEPGPMLWIDVPGALGSMQHQGHSWHRSIEAEIIVERIRRYKEKMGSQQLSIGVISFYSAQVNDIRGRLAQEKLLEGVSVGTVDAFQGKEYDVIFLSIVRTGICIDEKKLEMLEKQKPAGQDADEDETFKDQWEMAGRRQYGFLTSKNRLCVAMSRQKRLLVVVGDAALFHGGIGGRIAELFVPALKHLYELCAEKGRVEHG